MVSELWSDMKSEPPYGYDVVVVDNDGNWGFYDEIHPVDINDLINRGFHKWCYLADLVQAAYNM